MISNIIETIEILQQKGFDKKEAIGIILIDSLNDLKEVLKEK